ncbi:amidohydrolase family protein [Siccirubricoccus sp. KC 17139]|uniref:Amidohydrolase family protein n=1 Tax=Siccirubricoccus soli TaxID=2899147 RepID=A0ABT1CYQ9_9PROT|nr:amidohydrolase family protein [Siccirubricoccus soli]MCO6414784.1 amidohydrolase family protein [Siccirubricoccus soli]MCP2680914.1 amidohydrolase family protein [Siccirubricoccus soli]
MPIIDAQVHVYERNHPGRPWVDALAGPPEVTGDQMVAAMDEVGVDGALLVSVHSMYRYDASYAVQEHAKHPTRFALIKPVDPRDPGVAETIADWKAQKGTVGIRVMMRPGVSTDPADPGLGRVLAAAAKHGLALNLLAYGRLPQVLEMARLYPDTQIVIDHLGLPQPFHPPAPEQPWAALPELLALAARPNVAVKITGACTLAKTPYPYPDIWPNLARIFEAFGLERCCWGTDWTRAVALLSYREGVDAFRLNERLSESDKAMLMGGSVQRVYGWAPG